MRITKYILLNIVVKFIIVLIGAYFALAIAKTQLMAFSIGLMSFGAMELYDRLRRTAKQ